MAEVTNHAAFTAEIARLRDLQLEDLRSAAFLGWTTELRAAHEMRERQIAELWRQLYGLDETPS